MASLLGLSELRPQQLLRQLAAECIGTLLLVLVGCGSCMGGDQEDGPKQFGDQANIVRIALTFGLTVATLAATLGHVSGCHINPAVTTGLLAGRKMGLVRAALYMVAQTFGGILGAGILWAFTTNEGSGAALRGSSGLGSTVLHENLSSVQGFVIEFVISLILVLVVFGAVADEEASKSVLGSPPLAIGLAITACHLFAVPLTGSSMNPARTLGPAVITGNWKNLWVYWAAPLSGGAAAGLLYQGTFKAKPLKS